MSEFQLWLSRMVGISILCALAEELMPSGGVKQVGKLVCALLILWVMLSPIVELTQTLEYGFGIPVQETLEERTQQLEMQVENQRKIIIEEKYAAYIVDKAAALGVTCTAEVDCQLGEEGLYLPEWARMTGVFSDVVQSQMTQLLEKELCLPWQNQEYILEEGPM